jgi:Cft2 family RNA processing exonuclease
LIERDPERVFTPATYICAPSDGSFGSSRRLLRECLKLDQCSIFKVGWADDESPVGRIVSAAETGEETVQPWPDEPSYPMKASVKNFRGLSSHADAEGLESWCDSIEGLREVIVVHGTQEGREGLSGRLESNGYVVTVPRNGLLWTTSSVTGDQ